MKHTIEIEGLPEGWEPITKTIYYPFEDNEIAEKLAFQVTLQFKKKQPRRIVLEETCEENHLYESGQYAAFSAGEFVISGVRNKWREVKDTDLSLTNGEPKLKIGQSVRVYDAYRFASRPEIYGVIKKFGNVDNVCVQITNTNNKQYPVGSSIWIHIKQIEPAKRLNNK